jgi:hypothetical protein
LRQQLPDQYKIIVANGLGKVGDDPQYRTGIELRGMCS